MIELVLGGNKSGKSDFGLELLCRGPRPWTLVATGKSRDLAFRRQIITHRQSRDADIAVREVDTDLAGALGALAPSGGSVLVDSLDFWMFSLAGSRDDGKRMREEFFAGLRDWRGGNLILVSTEMGLGPLAFDGEIRAFARDLGQLNREIASVSTSVYLVVAGLAQKLK
ncbi:bifunctional adenosylcobinamide kinase/adenosylcobinamide-phosphate guanylyltransferase [Desulfomicrobium sp. ZS1]|uniref:bifunctional adenosylcobinamide kinase/adenosylcobinamide-phosphate guanylyltransferase n=1 Tax=Desulfomicrobium sp. ZS1 TaxID=2952228 RepID=UPI0020B3B3AD|nr:bifunctional adenosylcobinamide kinase/adenosylcobinamide-phosphate guanylyltransferase [Desulfomicrobium sp. ZS1]UTF49953.1 bifunctional adenosylcobinamide kinase/adenosylcobinamide-phosphate guanylyltransferase [Desulfomicrobium sp. ZS1]